MTTPILVATGNPGKLAEYTHLLADLPVEWHSLTDLGIRADVEETGTDFEANALLKAHEYGRRANMLTLADDSGLVVDALGGEPGVHSARYGGPGLDDAGRWRLLLDNLRGVPDEKRTARFVCTIAAVAPNGEAIITEGTLEGRIAHEGRGEHGFGYDPVFYLPERGVTLAELPPAQKNAISHRANAAAALRPYLIDMLTL
ncbi:MAG: RdgB/HAM1 family non-canonical purine NTP pyrophosphatase [Anaerolineae bacterium]